MGCLSFSGVTNLSILGWKGVAKTVPTGGDSGCTTMTAGTVTPGWCTGGSPGIGTLLGAFESPTGITGDSVYLYVTDTNNNRIQRVLK